MKFSLFVYVQFSLVDKFALTSCMISVRLMYKKSWKKPFLSSVTSSLESPLDTFKYQFLKSSFKTPYQERTLQMTTWRP